VSDLNEVEPDAQATSRTVSSNEWIQEDWFVNAFPSAIDISDQGANEYLRYTGAVTYDQHGNYYLCASYQGVISVPGGSFSSAGSRDVIVIKFWANRTFAWAVTAGSNNDDYCMDIVVDTNGSVYIMGSFEHAITFGNTSLDYYNHNAVTMFLAKVSSNGSGWEWATRVGLASNDLQPHMFHPLQLDYRGGLIVGGSAGLDYLNIGSSLSLLYISGYGGQWIARIHPNNGTADWAMLADRLGTANIDLTSRGAMSCSQVIDACYIAGRHASYGPNFVDSDGTTAYSITVTNAGTTTFDLARFSSHGYWDWVYGYAQSYGAGSIYTQQIGSLATDSLGNLVVIGDSANNDLKLGNTTHQLTGTAHPDAFVGKMSSSGTWMWSTTIKCLNAAVGKSVAVDSDDNVYISGKVHSPGYFGNITYAGPGSDNGFLARLDSNGNWQWVRGLNRHNMRDIEIFSNQTLSVILNDGMGLYEYSADDDGDSYGYHSDEYPSDPTQNTDTDGDGYGDNSAGQNGDSCPSQFGNSTLDRFGCEDADGDGWSNSGDRFPYEDSQWQDSDSDGFGDNSTGHRPDSCPDVAGSSTRDRHGCSDSDDDGYSNPDANWSLADGADAFPDEPSQHSDFDEDGYGDMILGFEGDSCPSEWGDSTIDRFGCPDTDSDGYSNIGDDLDDEPTQHSDRDGDGFGDDPEGNNSDEFPNDPTQSKDSDSDGFGDNSFGNQGDGCPDTHGNSTLDFYGCPDDDGDGVSNQTDAFPDDPSRWKDSDGDGYGDEEDAFPFDPTQHSDRDGDGFGDSDRGSNADKFPDDITQWSDIDGDGYGDNQTGTDADVFIADPTQHADRDGDGYGDSLSGRLADQFPDNPTQWLDQDGDGLGDNQSGTDADPYLFDFDNDGYNDSIDPLPMLASPGDIDNDGCLDEVDAFPLDYRECSDFDGDGEGDNADTDDDNDGWTDTDEIREDTDPLDASDYPIVAFQLMIPGTTIGLDGWDLIGIFGGVPLFAWILFGFATRNKRCRKYEGMLKGASTKKELDDIALKSEYSLMMRLLGPHQGIRLERLRAELDDALAGETHHVPEILEPEDITEDQTHIVEDEMVAGTVATGPSKDASGQIGSDGYEWTEYEGTNYFRTPNSGADWQTWKD
jgi:hypothetical protein